MSFKLDDCRMLITGGTGSFGNAVLERFLDSNVKEILVFSRDEKKQDDMRIKFSSDRLKFIIGDVRDKSSIRAALAGVDYVFHAAALKQVPACEFYPDQAVFTNVLGASNVIEACRESGVKKAILLSTDKAVYPINAMGMTKALMEKLVTANARRAVRAADSTIFCLTRYGNVMASRGSVIPLFVDQIVASRPITITDPRMTRFLMTLEESVDLVLHAFEHGDDGDLFVQKAPACTVQVLADALFEIFGVKPDISVIGTRHGEKVDEVLVSREDMVKAEDMGRYFRVPADVRSLNYHKYLETGEPKVAVTEEYSSGNTRRLDKDEVKELVRSLDYVRDALRLFTDAHRGERS
jgi:UDP-N-acetylglucosamine 4,6-dehydratase/5-epimerase